MTSTLMIDPESAIKKLDQLSKDVQELRELFAAGAFKPKPDEEDHAFDLAAIQWKRAKKDGGGDANLDDNFAWAFAQNMNGIVPPEKKQLVDYLKQYGKIQQNGYELSLSKDGKFLNRTRNRS